jgi:broad specificity phosphatase PhoE
MTIYLLRHGAKAEGDYHNPALKHQDQPLSEEGFRQAHALVEYFKIIDLSAIFVSAYLRTHQTAQPTSDNKLIPPVVDPRLNEIDNGYVDEMSEQEFENVYPVEWRQYVAKTSDFRFPGGENGEEVRTRIAGFLQEKSKLHRNENILIVSHEGLIRVCMTYLLDIPVFRRSDFKINPCGLTEFDYQADVRRWKILSFNKDIS